MQVIAFELRNEVLCKVKRKSHWWRMVLSSVSHKVSSFFFCLSYFLLPILNNIDLNVYLKDVHVHQWNASYSVPFSIGYLKQRWFKCLSQRCPCTSMLLTLSLFLLPILNNSDLDVYLEDVHVHQWNVPDYVSFSIGYLKQHWSKCLSQRCPCTSMLLTLFLFLLPILNNIDLNVYLKDVHVHQWNVPYSVPFSIGYLKQYWSKCLSQRCPCTSGKCSLLCSFFYWLS